ncbi:MAG: 50S ribosomal protein L29 [Gemmatimonadetes bacterium]|nr:50S ribosomal protein L29 [Gemmatimonadota bacterium]MCH8144022.1 50S ribosomal protein L29 [Gemmatimonadota bacterium]MCH8934509.1 50S ribosomal protein L29 [Gemmatimonadota bacterium]
MSLKDAEKKPLGVEFIRELKDDELQAELNRLEEAQFRLKFRSATEDITGGNPLQFRTIRRNIARMKTVLAERKSA